MDHQAIAERALGLIDLTHLEEASNASAIDALCARAQTNFGNVAAISLLAKYVEQAVHLLEGTDVNIAAIINFPAGNDDVREVMHEAKGVVADGATEVELYLPETMLNAADDQLASQMIMTIRAVTDNRAKLKVIFEASNQLDQMASFCHLALSEGADFVGLLTNQDATGASMERARAMLDAIKKYGEQNRGFKLMGGVSSIEKAGAYLALVDDVMGPAWTSKDTFRLGASSVLREIVAMIDEPSPQSDPGV